jgi:hypothetical protein
VIGIAEVSVFRRRHHDRERYRAQVPLSSERVRQDGQG